MVEPVASGILTMREAIHGAHGRFVFCDRWAFQSEQDLGISPVESRGPVNRALFAVAYSAPVSDPARPGMASSEVLALIPMENVLGFVACNKAPDGVRALGSKDPA
jgi:hypothetical protein